MVVSVSSNNLNALYLVFNLATESPWRHGSFKPRSFELPGFSLSAVPTESPIIYGATRI